MSSSYVVQLVRSALCRGQAFALSDHEIGLWLADPTVNGLFDGEVSAGDYARLPVTWGVDFRNEQELLWTPSSAWGAVSFIVWLAGGNVIDWMSHSIDLNASRGLRIPAGTLTVSLT